jgi:hypothetical protein
MDSDDAILFCLRVYNCSKSYVLFKEKSNGEMDENFKSNGGS